MVSGGRWSAKTLSRRPSMMIAVAAARGDGVPDDLLAEAPHPPSVKEAARRPR
jgi:hypothetical protein